MTTETFYGKGKGGRNAYIEIARLGKRMTATAEADHITHCQLLAALREQYPDYDWTVETCGHKNFLYFIGHGGRRLMN